jgi:hypothetical protein
MIYGGRGRARESERARENRLLFGAMCTKYMCETCHYEICQRGQAVIIKGASSERVHFRDHQPVEL